ncbi:MAG TPA: acyltransferase, partial [Blastococcus sp.]|nr:acyltransferase [Blastococcus sp.]
WNGPAWSVSAEALAYLAFPVLALLLFRLDRAVRARTLVWLGLAALVPLLVLGSGGLHEPFTWLIRLAGAFAAGALAALAVRKVWAHVGDHRYGSWPTVLTWVSIAGVVGTLYLTYGIDRPQARVVAVVFFPLLLVGLSLSRSGIARFLGTGPMVFGGRISYSVYLTHMLLVIEPFWALQTRWPGPLGDQTVAAKLFFVAVPVLACFTGWLLWRFVEEPAQRKMRSMVVNEGAARRVDELPTLQPTGTRAMPEPVPPAVPDAEYRTDAGPPLADGRRGQEPVPSGR